MEIMDGMSLDLERVNKEKLKSVFPECFSEDKLDIDKLLSLCGEYISNDFEKYKFEWKGKAESLQLAQRRSTGTLRPRKDESVNFDETENIYIKGDNLEVLKLLQTSYYRQVKMIYIDPPYNTGNDFVYVDDFADPLARYKEVTEQTTKSNPETMGRFHTNWLNMMYPRLRLAANLLSDDGIICISIDDNEVTNLKKLCDEVFGEENFIAKMVWQSTPGSNTGTNIITVTEYMLVYAKSRVNCVINTLEVTDETKYTLEDEYVERRGKYVLNKLDRRMTGVHYSDALNYPIEMPDGQMIYPGSTDYKNNDNWNYRWSKSKVEWGIKNGFIVFKNVGGKWNAYFKQYFKVDNNDNPINRSLPYQNLIKLDQYNSTQGTKEIMNMFGKKFFDYPKPTELIKYLINICPDKNALIMDFFSGSATTAHAVMRLNTEDGGNRRYICVQLPEKCDENSEAYKAGYKTICDIGMERIRIAGKDIVENSGVIKISTKLRELEAEEKPTKLLFNDVYSKEPTVSVECYDTSKLDIGFKVFELDTSNLKTWDGSPVEEQRQFEIIDRMNEMLDRVKADRTDLDMVYEIMLKTGIPLTYRIDEVDIQGKTAYSVGDDCLLLICLAENITPEMVDEMCDYAPAKLVLGKSSFNDATSMSNAHYICQDKDIELKLV